MNTLCVVKEYFADSGITSVTIERVTNHMDALLIAPNNSPEESDVLDLV